jgi:hypothetical protein
MTKYGRQSKIRMGVSGSSWVGRFHRTAANAARPLADGLASGPATEQTWAKNAAR